MANTRATAAPFRVVWLALAALLLTGCFDLSTRLALNSDGSGSIAVRVIYSPETTALIMAAGKPPPPTSNPNPNVKREFTIQEGQAVQTETTTFNALEELSFPDQHVSVARIGTTYMGAKRDRIMWTLFMKGGGQGQGAPPPALFAGRVFEVAMDLPCNVEAAADATFPTTIIKPGTGSIFTGSSGSVSWKAPLPVLMTLPPGMHTITFQAECWSWVGVKSGVTRIGRPGATVPSQQPQAPSPMPAPPPPPPIATAPQQPSTQDVVLHQFPLLSQVDRANYEPGSPLYDYWDTVDNVNDPTMTRPVWKLACLATVYTMLERGTGGPNHAIDKFYRKGKGGGGIPDNLTHVTVEGRDVERAINPREIADAIRNSMPVILKGKGGELGQHFVLVVGVALDGYGGVRELIINDPWPRGGEGPAQQNRIPAASVINYPYAGVTFEKMRMVSRKIVEPPPLPPSTASPATVSMEGTWSGRATQSDGQRYGVVIEFIPGSPDPAINYPELSCGGRLRFQGRQAESYTYIERITTGAFRCTDGGTVFLTPRGGTIEFYWTKPDGRSSSVSATLSRVNS